MPILKRENIMLCATPNPTNLRKNSINGSGKNLLVQRKLNGERCRVEWFHGEPVLISSYGNIFNLPEIKEQLQALSIKEPWDGELYKHGWSREQIHSVCSTSRKELHPDHYQLEFHIFDTQREDLQQWQRNGDVLSIGLYEPLPPLIKIVSFEVVPFDKWLEKTMQYLDEGYEGIIIRNPTAYYQRKRVSTILKFKPTEQDEYIIDGVEEAIDQYGNPKSMVGAFWVHGDDGTSFKVSSGKLTHDKRRHYWFIQSTLPGKTLIVKHELLKTTNDIPVSCIAVEVKE